MKTYLYLLIAIVAEIIATTSLKASEQFTKLWPSVLVVCGYITAFYFLSLTLKKLEIGITYALWSGVGIVLVTITGALLYKQKPDLPALIGMAFIITGVVIINLFSKNAAH
jgi:small multidrug resistance pump